MNDLERIFAQKSGFNYNFYGSVRNDIFFSSRQNQTSEEGSFYLFPLDKNYDEIVKEVEEGENDFLKYASNNIKSWKRININCFISKLSQGEENNYDIFCIINGNKGNEVTKFIQNHFVEELLNEIKIKKDIKNSIKESFLKMNKLMEGKSGMKEIYDLKEKNNEEEMNNYKKIINDELKDNNKNELNEEDKIEKNEIKVEEEENNIEEEINIFEEEDKEILDYTGCTLCLILIDTKLNKIYFENIGNSEVYIYNKDNAKELKSSHRPNDETEKARIKDNSLIINNKLYGVLTSARTFGNFAYKKLISDEPDIQEYDINVEDKYIFIANESILNIYTKEKIKELIEKIDENIFLKQILTNILDNKIAKYFYDNNTKVGFDNMTCTLINFLIYKYFI